MLLSLSVLNQHSVYSRSDNTLPSEQAAQPKIQNSDTALVQSLLLTERQQRILDRVNAIQESTASKVGYSSVETDTVNSQALNSVTNNRAASMQVISDVAQQQQRLSVSSGGVMAAEESDPLVLDLDGNGFSLSANTIAFDINLDGQQEHIPALQGRDRYLALDRNGNGHIDHGGELFGDQHGAANGFIELAKYDGNNDGLIDKQDAVYHQLLLTKLTPDNLPVKASSAITSINLYYQNTQFVLSEKAVVKQLGKAYNDTAPIAVGNLWYATT